MYRLRYESCRGEKGIVPRIIFCFRAKNEVSTFSDERSKLDFTAQVLWADADIYICKPDQPDATDDLGLFVGTASVQGVDRYFRGFDLYEPNREQAWGVVLSAPTETLVAIERIRAGKDMFARVVFRVLDIRPRMPNPQPMTTLAYGEKGANYPFVSMRIPESD